MHTRVPADVELIVYQYAGDPEMFVTVTLNINPALHCGCGASADHFRPILHEAKPAQLRCDACWALLGAIDTKVEPRG